VIRRQFVAAIAGGSAAAVLTGAIDAQQGSQPRSNVMGPMEQDAYRPVRLPAKSGVASRLTRDERDQLEYRIGCQCGCSLSVYICRTTDFSCQVSPAMHRDVIAMADGGSSAEEIIAAFTGVYGEKVLLAPPRRGFNWLAYILPFAVMAAGMVLVATVVRRLRTAPAPTLPADAPTHATPDELARLQSAVRDESR